MRGHSTEHSKSTNQVPMCSGSDRMLLWDYGNEHNNTEWKLSKRREVLVALSPLVQKKIAALDSHVDSFFQ